MRARTQAGFTLLETVMALVVLGVLAAMAAPMMSNGARAYNDSTARVETLAQLRVASERIARELREVRGNPLLPGNYEFDVMTAGSVRFVKLDGTRVTISEAAPLATLAYDTPAGAWTLTDRVASLDFRYLQADGVTPATGSADVAFVEFELVLNEGGHNFPQRGRVALRNTP